VKDHFEKKADGWDAGSVRVRGAKTIADAIAKKITLDSNMEVMDFGVGTGLLGFEIAKSTKKVYGVDTSQTMLDKLKEKNSLELSIETYCQDVTKEPIDKEFDGIVSSMTLHHVQDLELFFQTIYKNVKTGGFLAFADLEEEDGTFHSDNTGVHHFGFEQKALENVVKESGFKNVEFENINVIKKPTRDFGVFLLTASK